MNKLTKALIAGGLGALLLLGGTTYALWTDSTTLAGGTITAGNLQVQPGTPAWTDVSTGLVGAPISITLASYRIIPGDTIRGTMGVKGALDGNNMTANLALTVPGTPAVGSLLNGTTITYQVFAADGTTAISGVIAGGATVAFRSTNNAATAVASLPTLPAVLPASDNLVIKVDVVFDSATTNRDLVQATAALSDLGVSLTQTR